MTNKAFIVFILLNTFIALSGFVNAQTIKSCSVVFITPDCDDNCDNKDHDTKIRISVFGAHGHEVAKAYYVEDREFEDGSENAVACTVTDPGSSGAAFAQKIVVTIDPNGNDDWVFEARVTFMLSDGSTTITKMRDRVEVSRDRPTATLWKL